MFSAARPCWPACCARAGSMAPSFGRGDQAAGEALAAGVADVSRASAFFDFIEVCSPTRVLPGSTLQSTDLLWPRLTSGRPSHDLSTAVAQGRLPDLPGYDAPAFTLIPVGSTTRRSVQVSGFDDNGRLTPPCRLLSASCASGHRFAFGFLQIRGHPRNPCRSANSSPCPASRGLSPPNECALPGAP